MVRAMNPISDLDVWRAANMLIEIYGSSLDASMAAAQRADNAIEQGDITGERLWTRVFAAVCELNRTSTNLGEAKH